MSSAPFRSRWTHLSLRAKGVAVLVVPLAALFIALFSIYGVEVASRDAELQVARAYDTRAELLQLHVVVLDAQSAVNGYLAAGGPEFLKRFESARHEVDRSLLRLSSLAGGDSPGSSDLAGLQRATRDQLDLLDGLRTAGAPAARGSFDRVNALTLEMQQRFALLSQAQDLRLFRARENRDAARQRLFRVVILCGVIGPLGALFLHLIVAGRISRRLHLVQENARRLALGLPLEPAPPGNDEIAEVGQQIGNAAFLLRARERELRESERRYRELFDQAPIPYEETDREGMVRRFNQAVCALLKCTPDQVLGRKAWDFVAPEQQESFRAEMLARIAKGIEADPFECDYLLEDGSRIAVEIRENLIRNDRGEITGVCRSIQDVTQRNLAAIAARKVEEYALELRNRNELLARALDAARSATEAKSRFLAGVSHELRTPLNSIIGFSELMHDGKMGPISADHQECLSDILTSARHLLQLINSVLDLSKVEAGKMEFRPEATDVTVLVAEVRDVVRPLADQKQLAVITEAPERMPAMIDPGRLKQVLYNYLSNAVKFTPEGGRVIVRVLPEAGDLFRLEVEDTGIGIPAHEVSKLFQEFHQLSNSRKAGLGTGLGLALTRHIVEAQGGRVAVRSSPGSGSVFSAVLPLHARAGAAKSVS
jgi:PAS domain S-box-containing protein